MFYHQVFCVEIDVHNVNYFVFVLFGVFSLFRPLNLIWFSSLSFDLLNSKNMSNKQMVARVIYKYPLVENKKFCDCKNLNTYFHLFLCIETFIIFILFRMIF